MQRLLHITSITFLIGLLAVSSLNAQSIQTIDAPEVINGTTDDNLVQANFDVKNTSNSTINVGVRRVEDTILEGTVNYFCWIQCYLPHVDESPSPLPIGAGETVSNFYADYEPHGVEGSSFITYCFYDYDNPDDETCVTVEYNISGTSAIDDAEAVVIGSPQPNPAVDRALIPFELKDNNENAKLVVYNILGSEIKTVPVQGTEGTIDLNVSDLQAGLYIYSFYNSNKLLSSSRLVVK